METIRVSRHPGDGVAEIMLNRPEAMNSVSTAMAGELTRACAEIAAEPGSAWSCSAPPGSARSAPGRT